MSNPELIISLLVQVNPSPVYPALHVHGFLVVLLQDELRLHPGVFTGELLGTVI
jgi:hypothetical protein